MKDIAVLLPSSLLFAKVTPRNPKIWRRQNGAAWKLGRKENTAYIVFVSLQSFEEIYFHIIEVHCSLKLPFRSKQYILKLAAI